MSKNAHGRTCPSFMLTLYCCGKMFGKNTTLDCRTCSVEGLLASGQMVISNPGNDQYHLHCRNKLVKPGSQLSMVDESTKLT